MYTVRTLQYVELEHTYSDDGKFLSAKVIKGWQTVPSGPKKQKPQKIEIQPRLAATVQL